MQLKNYQQQALEQLDRWLDALRAARKETADVKEFYAPKRKPVSEALKNYPTAWDAGGRMGRNSPMSRRLGCPASAFHW